MLMFNFTASPTTPDSIRNIFASFEGRSRENLLTLTSSIKCVDRRESLKKTPEVNDRSNPDLRSIRHSLSIQNFDLSGLRHVELLDKCEPLYIYRLAMNMASDDSETTRAQAFAENSDAEDDVFEKTESIEKDTKNQDSELQDEHVSSKSPPIITDSKKPADSAVEENNESQSDNIITNQIVNNNGDINTNTE